MCVIVCLYVASLVCAFVTVNIHAMTAMTAMTCHFPRHPGFRAVLKMHSLRETGRFSRVDVEGLCATSGALKQKELPLYPTWGPGVGLRSGPLSAARFASDLYFVGDQML